MTDNPLTKYFRKPALYVSLPTKGKFNPEIDQTIIDEVGVMPMTAIDEITLRNPDALLNGEAMISLIESCVPSIKDARKLCNIDAEALYMAIQYATNGSSLTYTHKCEKCENKNDFNIDIDFVLNKFPEISQVEPVTYENLTIHMRPPTLESVTRVALIQLEEQRIVSTVRSDISNERDELELAKKFYKSFKRVAEYNVDLISETIDKIETPDGEVTDKKQIIEFLANVPTTVVTNMDKRVKDIAKKPESLNNFEFVCPECEHKQKVNIEINPANFS